MYIRVTKKQRSADSKTFYQYSLAQTFRVDEKVKQRSILYLGSSPLMADKHNRAIVLSILKAKIFKNEDLFPQTNSFPKNKHFKKNKHLEIVRIVNFYSQVGLMALILRQAGHITVEIPTE